MTAESPYQSTVSQLEDALDHIMRMAKASRTQTKRLKTIAHRAEKALNGEEFDRTEVQMPKEARSPISYETEIRVTKRELAAALEREQALEAYAESLREAVAIATNPDNEPEYHSLGMGCGLEDRGITNRYEAMRHGWDKAMERIYSEVMPPAELLEESPAASLKHHDLLIRAKELEDFADSLPKFQMMGAGTAMKLKARELRRQAEGTQREEDAVA